MRLVFVSAPFRSSSVYATRLNCRAAEDATLELLRRGVAVVDPLAIMARFAGALPESRFIEAALELQRHCDASVFLPGWQQSCGCCCEREAAIQARQRVWEYADTEGPAFAAWAKGEPEPAEPRLCRTCGGRGYQIGYHGLFPCPRCGDYS